MSAPSSKGEDIISLRSGVVVVREVFRCDLLRVSFDIQFDLYIDVKGILKKLVSLENAYNGWKCKQFILFKFLKFVAL